MLQVLLVQTSLIGLLICLKQSREDTHCCPQITDEDVDLLGNLHITPSQLNHSSGTNDLFKGKYYLIYQVDYLMADANRKFSYSCYMPRTHSPSLIFTHL
mgnify:CR=1 FL=1